MKQYTEFEAKQISAVKRGLLPVHDASVKCYGYLCCMKDMGTITADRFWEEQGRMFGMFIELEKEVKKFHKKG